MPSRYFFFDRQPYLQLGSVIGLCTPNDKVFSSDLRVGVAYNYVYDSWAGGCSYHYVRSVVPILRLGLNYRFSKSGLVLKVFADITQLQFESLCRVTGMMGVGKASMGLNYLITERKSRQMDRE